MTASDAEIVRRQREETAVHSPMEAEDFSRFVEKNWDPEILYEGDRAGRGPGATAAVSR